MTKQYTITVIDSDDTARWQRLLLTEEWGSPEPYYADGETLTQNVLLCTVEDSDVARLERALEADDSVIQYSEN